MRYKETNSEQIGGRSIIAEIMDDDTIIEVSAQAMSDIYEKLQANYDLTVYGNIEIESLTVMGNLVCFGNCKVDSMNVQGRCDIFDTLKQEAAKKQQKANKKVASKTTILTQSVDMIWLNSNIRKEVNHEQY